MPILYEAQKKDVYIYEGICNEFSVTPGPRYIWNSERKLYEYKNTLYPDKNYTKTFNPKLLFDRGTVIHYGNDEYRNNNKLIFDGEKLNKLYTKIDDYGSVPPDYVVGDNEGEFNIGDFIDIIDHNYINWLSKDKLKEIEIFEQNNKIYGKVTIRGKKWFIHFDISKPDIETTTATTTKYIKEYINELVEDYDNITKRHPFHQEGQSTLVMYI
jgi:hypothetical protein